MATLPTGATLGMEVTFESYPTRTWHVDQNTWRISGFTDELKAMAQAVQIALNIRRFRWQIYTPDSGHEIDAEGYSFETARVRLTNQIRDALLQDDRITDVADFTFTAPEPGSMVAAFTVKTIFGDLRTEVTA
ncbi:DUF2634 domain-containing protein [Oscillibacter sp.]|uniref:DUF2634 domain-containing protein n=1 Tax=Oscillibacter sp. TaxID=1945593 RepID=UPI002898262D|nr:DUF2634 domain-containing protein [Oscillibacter sp.]